MVFKSFIRILFHAFAILVDSISFSNTDLFIYFDAILITSPIETAPRIAHAILYCVEM